VAIFLGQLGVRLVRVFAGMQEPKYCKKLTNVMGSGFRYPANPADTGYRASDTNRSN